MINATTHQGAEGALRDQIQSVRHIGPRMFVGLLAFELALLVGVMVWALFWLLPPATPYAAPHDITPVHEAIVQRLGGGASDPLVEVLPGISVRESNMRGLSFGKTTYYYYVEGGENFDPLSRGSVDRGEVEILLRDDSGPNPVVIYRIL